MDILKSVLYILCVSVELFISFLLFAMLIRSLLTVFSGGEDGDGSFSRFLVAVTEPFIQPMRWLLMRFNILQDSPVDFSFTFTFLILWMLTLFLPGITL